MATLRTTPQEGTSKIHCEPVGISAKGFIMIPCLPGSRYLELFKNASWDAGDTEVERQPVFLHSFELKNSVPGSLQSMVPTALFRGILLVEAAKSNENSSNASSKPWMRGPRECIKFGELPVSLWIGKNYVSIMAYIMRVY